MDKIQAELNNCQWLSLTAEQFFARGSLYMDLYGAESAYPWLKRAWQLDPTNADYLEALEVCEAIIESFFL